MLLFYLTLLVGLSEKIKEMAKGSLRMFFTSIKLMRHLVYFINKSKSESVKACVSQSKLDVYMVTDL